MTNLKDQIYKHIVSHIDIVTREINQIEAFLQATPPNIEQAHILAHKLKGGIGTMGFKEASLAAHSLETYLKPDKHEFGVLLGNEMELFSVFKSAVADLKVEDSSLFRSMLVMGRNL